MNVGVARQEIEAVDGAMDVGINVGNLDGGSMVRTERDTQSYGNVGYLSPTTESVVTKVSSPASCLR